MGCSGGGDDTNAGGDGSGGSGSSGDTTSSSGSGVSLTPPVAGINDCNAAFLDDDGVCRPLPSKCPAGTTPDIDAGCVAVGVPDCDPSFVDDRGLCLPTADACPADSFPVPTLGCVSIDGDNGCGTGTWGNVPDDAINVYVDATYAEDDSDGTKDKPFATLSAALAGASAGARIVLAAGSYEAGMALDDAVQLQGVCASKVTLTATTASSIFSVAPGAGADIAFSDLTVDAPVRGVLVSSGNLALTRVWLRHLSEAAVDAVGDDTHVTIDSSVISDTGLSGATPTGIGVSVRNGATLDITRSALLRTQTVALQTFGGTVTADDVFVGDTLLDGGVFGDLASSQGAGSMTLTNVAASNNAQGLFVGGATMVVTDSVIGSTFEPQYGEHVVLDVGADVTLTRSAIADGDTFGIHDFGGKLTADDLLIEDLGSGPPLGAAGILSQGEIHLSHATVSHVPGLGVGVYGSGEVSGVIVSDIADDPSLGAGSGMILGDNSSVTVDRTFVDAAAKFGILAISSTSGSQSITHCTIENITGVAQGDWGIGIALGSGKITAKVEDTRIAHVHGAGVFVSETNASLARVFVSDVSESGFVRLSAPATNEALPPVADGVLFVGSTDNQKVTLEDVWIEAAKRSGVTLSRGAHTLTRVRATGGPLGLALRDDATVNETDSDFSGNAAETEDPTTLPVP